MLNFRSHSFTHLLWIKVVIMKHAAFITVGVVLFVAAIPEATADPPIVLLDVAIPEKAPDFYGYHIAAIHREAGIEFVVHLDNTESRTLSSARILFNRHASPDQKIPVRVSKTPDERIHLSFVIPERLLRDCVLDLDSGYIRRDNVLISNSREYWIRLEDVVPSKRAETKR